MAFFLRRPFAITTALRTASKSSLNRSFHRTSASNPSQALFASKSSPTTLALSKARHAFRRTYAQPASPYVSSNSGDIRQRLLYGAGIFGGTILAINLIFNRETREDGGMPPFERAYLNETFLHTGLGVGIIGVAARALHQSGWSIRLMASNPWLVIGGGLAVSIGTMYGCFATAPEK